MTKKSIGLRKRDGCLSRPCPILANCSLRHDHTKCLCHIEQGRKKCGRGGAEKLVTCSLNNLRDPVHLRVVPTMDLLKSH